MFKVRVLPAEERWALIAVFGSRIYIEERSNDYSRSLSCHSICSLLFDQSERPNKKRCYNDLLLQYDFNRTAVNLEFHLHPSKLNSLEHGIDRINLTHASTHRREQLSDCRRCKRTTTDLWKIIVTENSHAVRIPKTHRLFSADSHTWPNTKRSRVILDEWFRRSTLTSPANTLDYHWSAIDDVRYDWDTECLEIAPHLQALELACRKVPCRSLEECIRQSTALAAIYGLGRKINDVSLRWFIDHCSIERIRTSTTTNEKCGWTSFRCLVHLRVPHGLHCIETGKLSVTTDDSEHLRCGFERWEPCHPQESLGHLRERLNSRWEGGRGKIRCWLSVSLFSQLYCTPLYSRFDYTVDRRREFLLVILCSISTIRRPKRRSLTRRGVLSFSGQCQYKSEENRASSISSNGSIP